MTLPVFPPGTPVWLIVAVIIVLVLAAVSEKLAKLSGPFSWLARQWQAYQERAVTEEAKNSSLFQRQLAEVHEAVRRSDENHAREIADLRRDMADSQTRWEERDQRQQSLIDDLTDYAAYSISWGRDIRMAAAEHGWVPEFEPLLSFTAWRKTRPNARCPA